MKINTINENYLKEDFVAQTDEYLNELDIIKKKDLLVKISLGLIYATLLVVSAIVI